MCRFFCVRTFGSLQMCVDVCVRVCVWVAADVCVDLCMCVCVWFDVWAVTDMCVDLCVCVTSTNLNERGRDIFKDISSNPNLKKLKKKN